MKKNVLIIAGALVLFLFIIALVFAGRQDIRAFLTGAEERQCGIENCHGLDIGCGEDVPEACTLLYKLGDFCRQYARCEKENNDCLLKKDEKFDQCSDCIKKCGELEDNNEAFECEDECREVIKSELDPALLKANNSDAD